MCMPDDIPIPDCSTATRGEPDSGSTLQSILPIRCPIANDEHLPPDDRATAFESVLKHAQRQQSATSARFSQNIRLLSKNSKEMPHIVEIGAYNEPV